MTIHRAAWLNAGAGVVSLLLLALGRRINRGGTS